MGVLLWVLGVLAFVAVLALSIGLHEAGHMVAAKKLGLKVPRFFIGFGPTLFSRRRGETEYGVKAVPLGGFVMIEDESQEKDSIERSMLSHVKPWKRVIVFLAGPAVNIAIGTVVLISAFMIWPMFQYGTTVGEVNECLPGGEPCGAARAGILEGDRIVDINGNPVDSYEDLDFGMVRGYADVTVERDGEEILFEAVPVADSRVGITVPSEEKWLTLGEATSEFGSLLLRNMEAIAAMPSKVPPLLAKVVGQTEEAVPGSVVAVGKVYGDVSASTVIGTGDKLRALYTYSGLLNLGLGLLNLLPIMPLDGGRILVAGIDSVRGFWSKVTKGRWVYSPLRSTFVMSMTAVTAVIVFGFMALVIVSDVAQIVRGEM